MGMKLLRMFDYRQLVTRGNKQFNLVSPKRKIFHIGNFLAI